LEYREIKVSFCFEVVCEKKPKGFIGKILTSFHIQQHTKSFAHRALSSNNVFSKEDDTCCSCVL
jgi:hypothetical protein